MEIYSGLHPLGTVPAVVFSYFNCSIINKCHCWVKSLRASFHTFLKDFFCNIIQLKIMHINTKNKETYGAEENKPSVSIIYSCLGWCKCAGYISASRWNWQITWLFAFKWINWVTHQHFWLTFQEGPDSQKVPRKEGNYCQRSIYTARNQIECKILYC